ncbi:hypothetical protein CSB07_01510 [Candidatus Gracilibacteria bacterium]|nr:MAG: hypothetical protein CSB07_01510 [Candidatus Gracilibacteria bacterium]PIE85043.1 MAG: hypothetical protein CSA08_03830 [Candidatus Gracilibacteria bacterium]
MDKFFFKNSEILSSLWDNTTFEIVLKFFLVYFIIVWIALVIWVIKDITNRTSSLIFQIFSIFLVIFLSPLGLLIYLVIRPRKTLFDLYYDEIDFNLDTFGSIIKDKLEGDLEKIHCFNCKKPVGIDFNYCPYCKICLSKECYNCEKKLYSGWERCPYCGEECSKDNKKTTGFIKQKLKKISKKKKKKK